MLDGVAGLVRRDACHAVGLVTPTMTRARSCWRMGVGVCALAVSLVTQSDIQVLQRVEAKIGCQLTACKDVSEAVRARRACSSPLWRRRAMGRACLCVQEAIKHLKAVAVAMKVAAMRLADSGFEDALKVVKERKAQSRERMAEWLDGGDGGGGARAGAGAGASAGAGVQQDDSESGSEEEP